MACTPGRVSSVLLGVPIVFIESVVIVVDDFDPAISFFVDALGFELSGNRWELLGRRPS